MNNEKDILQQLEALKQENADSVSRCRTSDIKFNALLKHAQNSDRLELQIKKLQNCKEQNRNKHDKFSFERKFGKEKFTMLCFESQGNSAKIRPYLLILYSTGVLAGSSKSSGWVSSSRTKATVPE